MTDINPETGEVSSSRSPRFTQWVAFLVFSTITLGSAVEEVSMYSVWWGHVQSGFVPWRESVFYADAVLVLQSFVVAVS